ncbi:30S ribosomal protein S6 [Candidatus Latescibacterota bacterium]
MNQYDTMFIIDGTLEQQEREVLIDKYEKLLENSGGNLERTVRWGKREMAYEINKIKQGYYVIFYFTAEPSLVEPFEKEMQLNESILRYMTVLSDGKHPEYIRDDIMKAEEKPAPPVSTPVAADTDLDIKEESLEEVTDTDDSAVTDDDSQIIETSEKESAVEPQDETVETVKEEADANEETEGA